MIQSDEIPRFVISALRGGSGKTIVSIGLIAALKKSGKIIAPFKKGPDYIDAGWLALAAGQPCYNLDTFLVTPENVLKSFIYRSSGSDISIVEGNRGLFDGIDMSGNTSTAEIARLLDAPVILCLDCTKTTITMAAVVCGCKAFDPDIKISGVVLNRIAGPRHESILTKTIEYHSGIPVIGAIPKLSSDDFPERHMGLIPTHEHKGAIDSIDAARIAAEKYINLEKVLEIAFSTSSLPKKDNDFSAIKDCHEIKIGVLKDSAFQFYYPENLDCFTSRGAKIIYISPLAEKEIPEIDALYIGGGFPETHAEKLASNRSFIESLKTGIEKGLPVYAECGGLMFLGRSIETAGKKYSMAGIFPLDFTISKKPQGHGYVVVETDQHNNWFDKGMEIRGHEFRYSKVDFCGCGDSEMIFKMKRGVGIINGRDGLAYKNVLASYMHIHALGAGQWVEAMIRNAVIYNRNR